MASLIWKSIFVVLAAELFLTLLLVVPIPSKIAARCAGFFSPINNRITRFFLQRLKAKTKIPLLFLGVGLGMALAESLYTHQQILERIEEEREFENGGGDGLGHHHKRYSTTSYIDNYFYPGLNIKERRYKSERNMYLAGFALTLLFVIGRIATLLKESVELHQEAERLEKVLSASSSKAAKSKK
mmetsp:Transcript_15646/g.33846  ORF Transcript_15646/g.33846 Transcript_15646/m.33846 type:complete len:185 (-) Transcript_15646:2036-2590(-)